MIAGQMVGILRIMMTVRKTPFDLHLVAYLKKNISDCANQKPQYYFGIRLEAVHNISSELLHTNFNYHISLAVENIIIIPI